MDDEGAMMFGNRGIGESQTWCSTWETVKGNGVLETVGWVARRRRRAAAELGVGKMGGEKDFG